MFSYFLVLCHFKYLLSLRVLLSVFPPVEQSQNTEILCKRTVIFTQHNHPCLSHLMLHRAIFSEWKLPQTHAIMGTALSQIHTLPDITCDWQSTAWKCKHTPENNAALEVRTIQSPGCQLGQKLSFSTHPNTIKIKASFQVNSLGGAPQYASPSFYFPFRRKISFLLQDVYSAAWLTASGRSARTQTSLFSRDLACHHHKITISLNHVLPCFSRNLFQPWKNVQKCSVWSLWTGEKKGSC